MAFRERPMTSAVARWSSAVVTVAYVVVLLYATHHPRPDELVPRVSRIPDELLHFAAYGVLGSLTLATFRVWRGAPGAAALAGLFAGLALFAAVDEATQPSFSRVADPLDWLCDCLGLAVGMLAIALAAAVAVRLAASRGWSRASR